MSQKSIQLLEGKHYLEKTTEVDDGRVAHLTLSEAGRKRIDELRPLDIFKQAEELVSQHEFDSIGNALQARLGLLQKVNHTRSFG